MCTISLLTFYIALKFKIYIAFKILNITLYKIFLFLNVERIRYKLVAATLCKISVGKLTVTSWVFC